MAGRVPVPRFLYYGKEIWEEAAAALLCGENLLLSGPKATGKNVLAENLAAAFGRPSWDISFYVNVDAASLIGTDTFRDNQVVFREGSISRCAHMGGFGVLDEINMAKNESLAVLHATLDFRRSIDVPGYDRIPLHEATRFIATMNYGYAGTRELNEALASRFVVINMPVISEENLRKLLKREFPTLKDKWAEQFAALFRELETKCDNAEISTKALDPVSYTHLAFIYYELRADIQIIIKDLCKWKGVEIIEGHMMPDHIHLLVEIPPKMSVSQFMGYLKGKSAMMIFNRHANLKYKFGNRNFWATGYYVSTVGLNTATIQKYIREQEKQDQIEDKLNTKEYENPFKGSR